jgi:hypothetical protein
MNKLKSFKLFESNDLSSDSEYIQMLLAEIEDDNKYLVSCETMEEYDNDSGICITIKPRFKGKYIILDDLDLDSRIEQILAVLTDHGFSKNGKNFSQINDLAVVLKSINDYRASNIITKMIVGVDKVHDNSPIGPFSVLEPGMNNWENDMITFIYQFRLNNGSRGMWNKTYTFSSDLQYDEFEIEVDEGDIDSDVRLPITSILVHLKLKP